MKLPCEDCICLSVCLQKIQFEKNHLYSSGYRTVWIDYISCKVLELINSDGEVSPETNWFEVKDFFLKKKGLI